MLDEIGKGVGQNCASSVSTRAILPLIVPSAPYSLFSGPLEAFTFGRFGAYGRLGSVYVAGSGTVNLIYPLTSGHTVWTVSGLGNAAGLHIGRVQSVPSIVLSNSFAITAYTEF